jgi:hypothetical protein
VILATSGFLMWKCYVASTLQCSADDLALATAQADDHHGGMVRCPFLGLMQSFTWALSVLSAVPRKARDNTLAAGREYLPDTTGGARTACRQSVADLQQATANS